MTNASTRFLSDSSSASQAELRHQANQLLIAEAKRRARALRKQAVRDWDWGLSAGLSLRPRRLSLRS